MAAGIIAWQWKSSRRVLREKAGSEVDRKTNEDIKQGEWFGPGTE